MTNYNPMYYYPQYVPRQMYDMNAQQMQQTIQPPVQNLHTSTQPVQNMQQLQGKLVDNIEVVKALDIPLDGTTSYFPLTNGSAIITKQLQQDGTSKIVVYRAVEDDIKTPQYVTEEKIKELLQAETADINELKEEMKTIKRQIRDFQDDLKEAQKTKRKSDD